jgi:hypothetical protein
MSRRTASWLAWSLWALSLPLVAFSGVLGFLSAATNQTDSVLLLLTAFLALMFTTVGAVIASRRSENPIGWIFCIGGLILGVASSANNYLYYALHASSGSLPGVPYAAWVGTWAPLPTLLLAATMLFLLFPDGELPSRQWLPVAWAAIVGSVAAVLGQAFGRVDVGTDSGFMANPVAVGGGMGRFLQTVGGFGLTTLFLSCCASMFSLAFVRMSRTRGQERQQIKWFVYAAAIMIGGFLVALTFGPSVLMWNLGTSVGILGFALLPLATAIAIFRYRLYDIDRIINRTLVYGSLTVLLALVYSGCVTATQALFRILTSQQELSQLVIVVSTLVIAALFTPLRRRIQWFIDRSFYRRKFDAAKTLEGLSTKLRDETDLEALRGDLVGVVRETMQPAHVSLWLRPETASKDRQTP